MFKSKIVGLNQACNVAHAIGSTKKSIDMNSILGQFGNVPVTVSTLESLFPNVKRGNQKVGLLERDRQIIRLKRGLYVCSSDVSGRALSMELIANHLYAPSYVSMSSALRYYGLIPEAVYTVQSMTIKHSRSFDTTLARFEYTSMSRQAFPVGLTTATESGCSFVMATPEKALCDLIAYSTNVNLRYLKDAALYIEEDIRMDMDDFRKMDAGIFEEYISVGKKADSIRTLLKLLKR